MQRYLNNEPIQARPATAWRRFRKWLCRHPRTALILLVVSLSISALAAGALWHYHQLGKTLETSERLRTEVQRTSASLRRQLYATDIRLARQAWQAGSLAEVRELLELHRPHNGADDHRGFAWHYLSTCSQNALRTLVGHEGDILTVAVSPDDRLIASGDRGGTIKIWQFATGQELRTLRYSTRKCRASAFRPTVGRWPRRDRIGPCACLTWPPGGKRPA